MVAVGKDIYLFGGQGRSMFEELRLIDTTHKHEWNWVLLDTGDLIPKKKDSEGESSTP